MPSFLMLDECGFVSKDSVAVVTESNSLFFPLFLLPDHTGVLADLYEHSGLWPQYSSRDQALR